MFNEFTLYTLVMVCQTSALNYVEIIFLSLYNLFVALFNINEGTNGNKKIQTIELL